MAYKKRKVEYRIVEPSYSMSYTLGQRNWELAHPKSHLTSLVEIRDILAALAILTVAFEWIIYRPDGKGLFHYLSVAALVVFAGFLIHEMSHKFIARRYGCWAEFRADYRMLGLSLLTAFFGFLFAAPGAVMIAGPVDRPRNGKISLAGPGSNFAVGGASLLLLLFTNISSDILSPLYLFSLILGGFNMIPVMPFDGSKIWAWSKAAYIMVLVVGGLLLAPLVLSGTF